jgi:hypothetical protein
MHAINLIQEVTTHAQIAVPTLVRVALPFLRETVGHVIHKCTHHAIGHTVAHRSHFVHKALGKCPWLLDGLIIAVMLTYGTLTEPHEGGEGHAGE